MIRKAAEVCSFSDLDINPKTRGYIERNYPTIAGAIMDGRWIAYSRNTYLKTKKLHKWTMDLLSALDEGGFIRPASDFTLTFNVNRLYTSVYNELDLPTGFDYLDNESYENFQPITDDEYKAVKAVLNRFLDDEERDFLSYYYGLSRGGLSHTFTSTRNLFGLTEGQAANLELSALSKLRERDLLPQIYVRGC